MKTNNIKTWIANCALLKEQEHFAISRSYEKPQLQELAVPSNVVCGGSNYDLGDKRNFEGLEEETKE